MTGPPSPQCDLQNETCEVPEPGRDHPTQSPSPRDVFQSNWNRISRWSGSRGCFDLNIAEIRACNCMQISPHHNYRRSADPSSCSSGSAAPAFLYQSATQRRVLQVGQCLEFLCRVHGSAGDAAAFRGRHTLDVGQTKQSVIYQAARLPSVCRNVTYGGHITSSRLASWSFGLGQATTRTLVLVKEHAPVMYIQTVTSDFFLVFSSCHRRRLLCADLWWFTASQVVSNAGFSES